MSQRIISFVVATAMVFGAASAVLAQGADLTALKTRTSFGAAEEGQIAAGIKGEVDKVITGPDDVAASDGRDKLIKLVEDTGATAEFRIAAAKVIVTEIKPRLNLAVSHRNRLAAALVVSRMQNPESLEVLLKLLGEGKDGEPYASVRYWAAKALAGQTLIESIRTGKGTTYAQPAVLQALSAAAKRESSPIVAAELFNVLGAIQTEAAVDVLVAVVADRARHYDLGQPAAADAMKSAVSLLQEAYGRERREASAGKQPIIAAIVQILVRTPPHSLSGAGLDLLETLDAALAKLTGEKTDLVAAIKEFRGLSQLGRTPQAIDVIFLQQLNWMETLLKTTNKDVRLLSRPEVVKWTSKDSAELLATLAKSGR
jgi:hypothetical protein